MSTSSVLLIGACCVDIVNVLPHALVEDQEVRVLEQFTVNGGNSSNTAVVLAQQEGFQIEFVSTLGSAASAAPCLAEFKRAGIDIKHCVSFPEKHTPTSYIALAKDTGSRTIQHFRTLPELAEEHLEWLWADGAQALSAYNWIHLEARRDNIHVIAAVMQQLSQRRSFRLSVEIEKPCAKSDLEHMRTCIRAADTVFFSKDFVQGRHLCPQPDVHAFLAHCTGNMGSSNSVYIVPWGEHGAFARQGDHVIQVPACPPAQVVDTIGCGDTFIAGFIQAALAHPNDLQKQLLHASRLAGRKAGMKGLTSGLLLPL